MGQAKLRKLADLKKKEFQKTIPIRLLKAIIAVIFVFPILIIAIAVKCFKENCNVWHGFFDF